MSSAASLLAILLDIGIRFVGVTEGPFGNTIHVFFFQPAKGDGPVAQGEETALPCRLSSIDPWVG